MTTRARHSIIRAMAISCLIAFFVFALQPALDAPVVDGVISVGEYGDHGNNQNQLANWHTTWDDTTLYLGLSGKNVAEGAGLYLDKNPSAPVNGGANADGTLVGQDYDGANFAALPFRRPQPTLLHRQRHRGRLQHPAVFAQQLHLQ